MSPAKLFKGLCLIVLGAVLRVIIEHNNCKCPLYKKMTPLVSLPEIINESTSSDVREHAVSESLNSLLNDPPHLTLDLTFLSRSSDAGENKTEHGGNTVMVWSPMSGAIDKPDDIKILLWWDYSDPNGEECGLIPPDKRCIFTSNRREYNSSDVVIIHMRDIHRSEDLPSYRFLSQKWVFMEIEPPTKTWSYLPGLDPNSVRKLFNLTYTFTLDSDIPYPTWQCYKDERKYRKLAGINFAAGKTRNVAWFASHCHTPNRREEYVKELSQFIQVDIYGSCGTERCGDKHDRRLCDLSLLHPNYKFYLSFENSFCDDYVTEKLRRMMDVSVIPVVMGYANYSNILPTKSFIDVRDFESPQELARYLTKVANDDKLFNRYIRNKNSLTCSWGQHSRQCEICSYLHQHAHQQQTFDDVVDFWSVEKKCISNEGYWRDHKMPVNTKY